MGHTLSFRTCQPISPEQEAAIRLAADSFNQGRTWVLTFLRDERDGHLVCIMKPSDVPDGDPAAEKPPQWPGADEAKWLLESLCGISRYFKVDLETHATGYTLSFRTRQPISPEQEAAIRAAADSLNQGQTWVLTFLRDKRDGHLICGMKPSDAPDGDPAAEKPPQSPGAHEYKCLLDGLCGISRDCEVDWEIHASYSLRPIGSIRSGECHFDAEAHAEAVRNLGEMLRPRSSKPWWQFW